MLKAFFYGAVTALIGSKLKKLNRDGKLEPYKKQLRKGAEQLKVRIDEQKKAAREKSGSRAASTPSTLHRPAPPPAASQSARISPSDEVSKPARAHPWPVDPRALPRET